VAFVKESLVFSGEDSPMANLMLSVMVLSPNSNAPSSRNARKRASPPAKQRCAYKGRKKTLAPETGNRTGPAGSGIPKVILARD
jgi:hypothetical protein